MVNTENVFLAFPRISRMRLKHVLKLHEKLSFLFQNFFAKLDFVICSYSTKDGIFQESAARHPKKQILDSLYPSACESPAELNLFCGAH